MVKRSLLLLTVLALAVTPLVGLSKPDARIEPVLAGVDAGTQQLHHRMLVLNSERRYEAAIETAELIIDRIRQNGGNPAVAIINLSLIQAASGDLIAAVASLDRAIDAADVSEVHASLIRPLELKGLLLRMMGRFEESVTSLRQAQNIVHRTDGVYSMQQQDILQQLTVIDILRRDYDAAVRQKNYAYIVSRTEFGEDSAALLPHTYNQAMFLASLGRFRSSINLLEEVVGRVEEYHGKDSLELIGPLRSIAEVRLLQRELTLYDRAVPNPEEEWLDNALGPDFFLASQTRKVKEIPVKIRVRRPLNIRDATEPGSGAPDPPERFPIADTGSGQELYISPNTEYSVSVGITDKSAFRSNHLQPYMKSTIRALQRVVDVLAGDATSDPTDRAMSLVELGDMYIVTGSAQAFDVYRRAWQLMGESPDPEGLRTKVFGVAARIQPHRLPPLPLDKKSVDGEYEAEVLFDVNDRGKIFNIRIVNANVPPEAIHDLKRRLFLFDYRPRMRGGSFAVSLDQTASQRFYGRWKESL